MNEVINKETLISVKELATILNVSDRTIHLCITNFKTNESTFASFGKIIKNNQGGYILNELQCTAIKKHIQGHHNLKDNNTIKTVTTDLDGVILVKQAMEYLNSRISILENENQEMKPKAEYFDKLVHTNLLTNFRDTAKELNISQNDFIQFLINNKYVYRDSQSVLKPYSPFMDLFQIKEWQQNEKTGTQTLITPVGRETFRLLLQREVYIAKKK